MNMLKYFEFHFNFLTLIFKVYICDFFFLVVFTVSKT
jgi:hypothetical protein